MRRTLLIIALIAIGVGTGAASSSGAAPSTVSISAPTITVRPWQSQTDNLVPVQGRVLLNGAPVAGVRLRVNGYLLPQGSTAKGEFVYLADSTLLAHYDVTVENASHAKTAGAALAATAQAALRAARGTIETAYPITGVTVSTNAAGSPVIEGRMADATGHPPSTVALYSYALTGRLTDANGKPVVGARISTRTVDRDYWTVSSPTTRDGSFQSLFTASSEAGGNPVPMTIRVSEGDLVYQYLPTEYAYFQRLQSARIDLRLPPKGYPIALPVPRSYPGAIFEGIVVGAQSGGSVVRPVSVSWPDRVGHFRMVLPRSLAGHSVSLWEGDVRLFSATPASPGQAVDLKDWPEQLPAAAARGLAHVVLK
jgi:hypothetical protein